MILCSSLCQLKWGIILGKCCFCSVPAAKSSCQCLKKCVITLSVVPFHFHCSQNKTVKIDAIDGEMLAVVDVALYCIKQKQLQKRNICEPGSDIGLC